MPICEFTTEDPPEGKKLKRNKWHFLVLTIGPRSKLGAGYRVRLMVDGVSHFDGGGFDEQFTIMGVDFWKYPNCIYEVIMDRLPVNGIERHLTTLNDT